MTRRQILCWKLLLSTLSIGVTAGVWAWVLQQPAGRFDGPAHLYLTVLCFPATFMVWFFCSAIWWFVGKGRITDPPGPISPGLRLGRWVSWGLMGLSLGLSVGTLLLR
ncbi:MAG TPA: hypothetical protein DCM86_15125 [Verrucomicrobiales bacterium]|nr:hypothetical protein [Verrucomicrobiales bacterium]